MKKLIGVSLFMLIINVNIAYANTIIATAEMYSVFADPTVSVNAIRVEYNDRYNQVNIGYEPIYRLFDLSGPLQFGVTYVLDSGSTFDTVAPLMTDGLNDSISFLAQHNPPTYAGAGWTESMLFHDVSLPVYDVPPAQGVDLMGYTITSMELTLFERVGDENIDAVLAIRGAQVVPIPAAVWLFTSGLFGLIGVARRRAGA